MQFFWASSNFDNLDKAQSTSDCEWNVFAEGLEEEVVEQAADNTEVHVNDTNNDGHLHLVAVEIWQLSLGSMPDGVVCRRWFND